MGNWNAFSLEPTRIFVSQAPVYSFKTSSMGERGLSVEKMESSAFKLRLGLFL